MGRNQCYGMGTQESYEVHEETWGSSNGHHNHFPGVRMTNGAHHGGMFREGHHGSSSGHHGHFSGGGHNVPFGGAPLFPNGSHHQSHGRDSFSEVNKYEEMRYGRHDWGSAGGNGFCPNPYDRNRNNGFHKVEWGVKGV